MGFFKIVPVVVVAILATSANAGVKISMSAAMAQCEKASERYSQTIVGRGAETPGDDRLAQYYRSCVHAKAGTYPPKRPARNGLRISGSMAFGLVYTH